MINREKSLEALREEASHKAWANRGLVIGDKKFVPEHADEHNETDDMADFLVSANEVPHTRAGIIKQILRSSQETRGDK